MKQTISTRKSAKKKKIRYYETTALKLVCCRDAKEFWKEIKKINGKSLQISNNLSIPLLREHFQKLLNPVLVAPAFLYAKPSSSDAILDGPFTDEEARLTMNKLKDGKAPGSDRITVEFLKFGTVGLGKKLTEAFNEILETGMIPQQFKESILFPIHKKGDMSDPKNYRGISFLNAAYKIFVSVLNNRLCDWMNLNSKLKEFQAGFRSGYSTSDNIFILRSIAGTFLELKKRSYTYFSLTLRQPSTQLIEERCFTNYIMPE